MAHQRSFFDWTAISAIFLTVIMFFISTGCSARKKPETDLKKNQTKLEAEVKAKAKTEYFNRLRAVGCNGDKIKLKAGSARDHKNMLLERYGFFLNPKGYKEEKSIFDRCSTVEAMDQFFDIFWSIRDPDPTTPSNEYKDIIDQRILDVQNEVLFQDLEASGINFASNGGLRGEMARVYLLRGMPSAKVKASDMVRIADLMVWYYVDVNQRPMFIFLFYNKGTGYQLFKKHGINNSPEYLIESLRVIAQSYPTTQEEFQEIYQELQMNDPEFIFRTALQTFSYYDKIRVEDAIAPPSPEVITAKAIQPKILGIPDIPKDAGFLPSSYFATIPGKFRFEQDVDGNYRPILEIVPSNVDWEGKGQVFETGLDFLVTFVNRKTREKKEFVSGLNMKLPVNYYQTRKDESLPIDLKDIRDRSIGGKQMTIPEMIKTLEPGDYEVKIRLLHQKTFKSGVWFEYLKIE